MPISKGSIVLNILGFASATRSPFISMNAERAACQIVKACQQVILSDTFAPPRITPMGPFQTFRFQFQVSNRCLPSSRASRLIGGHTDYNEVSYFEPPIVEV